MKKNIILLTAAIAGAFCFEAAAQESFSLDNCKSLKFYGIDFAPVKVIGAEESSAEFIQAFSGINNLFLSEPDKYIDPLADRLKVKIESVDIDYVQKSIEMMDASDLKANKTPKPFTAEDLTYELQDLDIEASEGVALVIVAGELNKGTDYGTFYYVFFDNSTMEVLDVLPLKGKSGGIGLRNYWARSFFRTIAEINPTRFYQAKKKVKEGVTEGAAAVKDVFVKQ
ncbi:MAG: hypothetical protein ACI3ZC_10275 [Candidatus Cryptobacteroides sp.]